LEKTRREERRSRTREEDIAAVRAMALLTDLVNLDLSGCSTDKIIAEYMW
jgi:hypothetical protein